MDLRLRNPACNLPFIYRYEKFVLIQIIFCKNKSKNGNKCITIIGQISSTVCNLCMQPTVRVVSSWSSMHNCIVSVADLDRSGSGTFSVSGSDQKVQVQFQGVTEKNKDFQFYFKN